MHLTERESRLMERKIVPWAEVGKLQEACIIPIIQEKQIRNLVSETTQQVKALTRKNLHMGFLFYISHLRMLPDKKFVDIFSHNIAPAISQHKNTE